jgi:hypothetical protein
MKHPELIELLPWYANATLDNAERQAVEEHLAGCPECVSELEHLMAMRQATLELADETPEPSPFLLNRALARIEDHERTQAPVRRATVSFRERVTAWWPWSPFFMRAALATQFAIMLALGTVAVYQHNHPQTIYITSSGNSGEPTGAGAKISVMFSPDATEREISIALGEIHGTIIDGPTAQSLYTVQLQMRPEQTSEIERALQSLRQNRRVVRLAVEKK